MTDESRQRTPRDESRERTPLECPEWECELEMPRTEMKAHLQWDHNRDESEAEAMITAATEGPE